MRTEKRKILEVLKKLSFVKWDRYFGEGYELTFFGWIDRKDNYKDFMVLDFCAEPVWFATSSAEYSAKIAEMLGRSHSVCKRVEDFCELKNVIKLEGKHES